MLSTVRARLSIYSRPALRGMSRTWTATPPHQQNCYQTSLSFSKSRRQYSYTMPVRNTMKALVYNGPGKQAIEDRPVPKVEAPTDAIVQLRTSTICGTDLHILKGDVPDCKPGTILGHEGVGIVREVGAAVTNFKPGDEVIISCITSCGRCEYCRRAMYSHCTTAGWILGNLVDGTQAEYVKIRHADFSLYAVPPNLDDETLVMLSDVLPTAFEVGVVNGQVKPGNTVAIVGAGGIGQGVLLTAKLYSPAQIIMIDLDDNRLKTAATYGATSIINSGTQDAVAEVKKLTDGKGVDTVIEAVGIPQTWNICQQIVAPGGTIANVGVHGSKVDLHLETLWTHNITIKTGLVDANTTPMLLKTVQAKTIKPGVLVTHRFPFTKALDAYETFGSAAKNQAMKVILNFDV